MPYEDTSPAAIAPNVIAGKRPQIGSSWPEEMKLLISLCWDAKPSSRPNVAEIRRTVEVHNYLPFPQPSFPPSPFIFSHIYLLFVSP